MARFHLVHCIPHPRMHGLKGYTEIAESLVWGLRALGHEATYGVNRVSPEAVNIILGAQILPQDMIDKLPDDTIVYNLEQLRGTGPEQLPLAYRHVAKRFRVWEYSTANLEAWKDLGADRVTLVPLGYAPTLTRIPKPPVQDIDVLMYGLAGMQRLECLQALSSAGLTAVFVIGLYGAARDSLIARSRIVLNVHLYDNARIFEIARVSYLLANRKAVVSVIDAKTSKEPDMEAAVRFTTMDAMLGTVETLLQNDDERARLENAGFELFSQRVVTDILAKALGDPAPGARRG